MGRRPPYDIAITPEADDHLAALTAAQRKTVLDSLHARLAFQPTVETRNRKRLRPNPVAPWELRLGDLRVYFDVEEKRVRLVKILAVGIKDRSRVRIGREEVDLE